MSVVRTFFRPVVTGGGRRAALQMACNGEIGLCASEGRNLRDGETRFGLSFSAVSCLRWMVDGGFALPGGGHSLR
jgi:hypothetical protein